ncbi:hypothetical protein ACGFX4_32025 [Kitasatospora sp. NPDC048365]|uniref:hypothetical protein n=1 Tax=Kitasatospora sp. NPDC048365 TaxID=3364050 RepID=UPI003722D1E5
MKLRTLLYGAAFAAANLLLPVPPADALAPYPAHPAPAAAVLVDPTAQHPTHCVHAFPLAAAHPC